MMWPDPIAIGLDGKRIWGPIYQGALPTTGPGLARAGIPALVVCAAEICPHLTADSYPGVLVHLCPLYDERAPIIVEMWRAIDRAADFVEGVIGEPVLIACQQGKNRSALVTAAAIQRFTGWSGEECIRDIQKASPRTFSNSSFAEAIRARWP